MLVFSCKKALLTHCELNCKHQPGSVVIQEKCTDENSEGRITSLYVMQYNTVMIYIDEIWANTFRILNLTSVLFP